MLRMMSLIFCAVGNLSVFYDLREVFLDVKQYNCELRSSALFEAFSSDTALRCKFLA